MNTLSTPPNKFPSSEDLTTFGSRNKRLRPNFSPTSPKQHDEIMTMLSTLLSDVAELRKSNNEIQKSLEFQMRSLEEMNSKINKLEAEKLQSDTYTANLEARIDELERHTKSSCLEIRGIPSKVGETKQDLNNLVEKLHAVIRTQVQPNSLNDIYRINRKSNGECPIIVDFCTNLQKGNILQAVKKYNASNTTNKLNTESLGIAGGKTPVYVSEALTRKAKRLYYLAREASRALGYDFCWTANGRIFIRKSEGQPPTVITNEKQLEELKQKN